MTQGKLVLVKRQVSDQIWHEAISFEQYKWEQTHATEKGSERETSFSREGQLNTQ